MKRMVLMLILLLALTACGNTPVAQQTPAPQPKPTTTSEASKPTQTELDAKLKKEAAQANFIELNSSPEKNKDKRVYAKGGISAPAPDGWEFTLSTKEGNGNGMYSVKNLSRIFDIKAGEEVKIYGTFSGKDSKTGMPIITATILEKVTK
ncbi:MAG TPA: hypothetical protein DEF36_12255 [Desulfotomaculum sp.]|nr:hypothetical protein [Desulfotomaculum sp.]